MPSNTKELKRLAQAPAIKAARDKLTVMSPAARKAALRIAAARQKKLQQKR